MTWKTVLYDFVNARNEAEGGKGILPAMPYVRDDSFVEAESARIIRRSRVHEERGLHPIRQESRLKLKQVEEAEGQITVYLETAKTFEYELKGRLHREERLDRERVILVRRASGEWLIQTVSPYISENDATRPTNPFIQPPGLAAPGRVFSGKESVPVVSSEVFSLVDERPTRVIYDRGAVLDYAEKWWNSYNPQYLQFEVDCTSYVSQCLFAGRAPMHYTGKRESGWWYRGKSGSQELWSFSWAVAQSLQNYLLSSRWGLRGEEVSSPAMLTIGDLISYSWDGARFTHSTIVTGIAGDGMPLVNAHTVNCRGRYWDYRDSYAWTERTAYRFFHIPDRL